MSTNVYVICVDSVNIHNIECIRKSLCLVSTVLTYIVFNQLNIKDVMTVYTVLCKSHKHQCLCVYSVNNQHSIHNTQ